MSSRISENIVICIDTSRSMIRSDYPPSRIACTLKAIRKLVKERLNLDPASHFAIVKFSDNAEQVLPFSNIEKEIMDSLENFTVQGTTAMGEALAISIKVLINELRKIAAKIPRILLISDGNNTKTAVDPIKMARIAQGLNIKVDTFRIGEAAHLNILKRLSDISKGRYYYNNDIETLYDSAINFANSNLKQSDSNYENLIEDPNFLRKIAAPLLRVQDLTKDEEQRLKQIRGLADYKKCSICFSDKDPITKGSFFLTGRYCPNCSTPFHIHCLAGWADSQEDSKVKKSGTVRCPHCFYLLKIPTEVSQAQKLKTLTEYRSYKNEDSTQLKETHAIETKVTALGDEAFYNSCPVCNMIFEENQNIIKCGNSDCGTLYHKECFAALPGGICKNCGRKLILSR